MSGLFEDFSVSLTTPEFSEAGSLRAQLFLLLVTVFGLLLLFPLGETASSSVKPSGRASLR